MRRFYIFIKYSITHYMCTQLICTYPQCGVFDRFIINNIIILFTYRTCVVFEQYTYVFFCVCLAPSAALIIAEECSAENNSVTIAWQPPASSYVEGYVLELDDGNGGDFRVCTTKTIVIISSRRIDFSRKTVCVCVPIRYSKSL